MLLDNRIVFWFSPPKGKYFVLSGNHMLEGGAVLFQMVDVPPPLHNTMVRCDWCGNAIESTKNNHVLTSKQHPKLL